MNDASSANPRANAVLLSSCGLPRRRAAQREAQWLIECLNAGNDYGTPDRPLKGTNVPRAYSSVHNYLRSDDAGPRPSRARHGGIGNRSFDGIGETASSGVCNSMSDGEFSSPCATMCDGTYLDGAACQIVRGSARGRHEETE